MGWFSSWHSPPWPLYRGRRGTWKRTWSETVAMMQSKRSESESLSLRSSCGELSVMIGRVRVRRDAAQETASLASPVDPTCKLETANSTIGYH